MLLATGPYAGAAHAMAPASTAATAAAPTAATVKEEKAQLKADESALLAKQRQWKADEAKYKADKAAGRLAGISPDALKVYKDQQAINGESKDLAADKRGSLQMKMDKAALTHEEKQLAADKAALRKDRLEGKMAAQSADAEKAYKDLQFINGERKEISAERLIVNQSCRSVP